MRMATSVRGTPQEASFRTDLIKAQVFAAGVQSPFRCLVAWQKGDEFARKAPDHIQESLALEAFFIELYNGGIDQYFFNSAGDWWPQALSGLDSGGLQEAAEAFRAAIAAFGSDGPSVRREVRVGQLSAMDQSRRRQLAVSNDVLMDTSAEEVMWAHVLANLERFRVPALP